MKGMFGSGVRTLLGACSLWLAAASTSEASIITYNFTGVFSKASTASLLYKNGGQFQAGQTVSGYFKIDTTVLDKDGTSTVGNYPNSVIEFVVTYQDLGKGEFVVSSIGPGATTVWDDNLGLDRFNVVADPVTAGDVNSGKGIVVDGMRLRMDDDLMAAIKSDHLTDPVEDLFVFNEAILRLFVHGPEDIGDQNVDFALTSLDAVPAPPTLIVLGLFAGSYGCFRGFRRKNATVKAAAAGCV